jgi:hypothetical protein
MDEHHHTTVQKHLGLAIALNAVIFAVELVGGLLTKSLALISDAMHNLSEIAGCMACHGSAFISNVNAKMECMQCHGDPHATTAVKQMDESAGSFQLHQNYPNPFNPATSIQFSLPQTEKVHLAIYDIRGRLVRTLVDHELYSQGWYTLNWDGRDNLGQKVASGIYFTKLQAGKFAATRKMTLVE